MSKGKDEAASGNATAAPADNLPSPAALDRLRGQLVPFALHFFEETPSTNTTAAELAAAGRLAPPAVVAAARQTRGRGRMGRTWFSGWDSLAATFVLPAHPDRPIHQLPLVAGLAVREALAGLVGEIGLKVKWPNDILLEGRKVAGLLCERKGSVDLVGIGINIRHAPGEPPAELRKSVIALAEVASPPDRWEVLGAVARMLTECLVDRTADAAWSAAGASWPGHDALLGKEVEVATPAGVLRGRAHGIDPQGRLRLTGRDGVTNLVVSGSVRANS